MMEKGEIEHVVKVLENKTDRIKTKRLELFQPHFRLIRSLSIDPPFLLRDAKGCLTKAIVNPLFGI